MDNLKIEYLPVSSLKMYEKNARKHEKEDVQAIVESIKEFGFDDPIGIWGDENTIVEGHGRLMAAQMLGMDEVPCIRLDHLDDEQRRAYALAHNKTAELSNWDPSTLSDELDDITDIDMSKFGFDLGLADDPVEIEEDEPPEVPEEATSKVGQLWQLGRHRLLCGDSTDPEQVKRLVGGVNIDLLLTDPPYNVDYTGKTKDALKIENDKMEDETFLHFLADAFSAADGVMKPGAAFYIWHADSEGYNFRKACKEIGWQVRQCLVWVKNTLVMGRQDYQWKHEPCLYGWKDGGPHTWESDRKQTTTIDWDRPTRSDIHPTMKPVGLFGYLIKNSTKKEETVLDLFSGSGTTLIACEELNRTAYCMEYDPRYVDAIIQRFENITGEKAVLLDE